MYTGRPITSADVENMARRRFGLPEEVQLVFYPRPKDESSKTDILEWDIAEETEGYTTLLIRTEEKDYRVCSGIVAFMQEPDFMTENR